jgi:phospholipase/carboxylesterase
MISKKLDAAHIHAQNNPMTAFLDGPRLAPHSGTAKQLVVFLHGYGSNGDDLIELGHIWQTFLPDTAFVSPHAPEPCDISSFGRQWFPLNRRDEDERWAGVTQSAPILNDFLDQELERYHLTSHQLALVGFSQGTMMALHIGLRRATSPSAIIGYSGLLVGEDHLDEINKINPPAVLLTHGDHDDVIPPTALAHARDHLTAAGIDCQAFLIRGLGHSIDQECLQRGAAFLKAHGG